MKTMTLLLACLVAGIAVAQPSMTPPAELKALDWMKGEWTGTFKMTMEGSTMEMTSWMKVSMEGQFMKFESTNEWGGMKMTEVGFLGWNASTKKYGMWTFTNMSPEPRIESGAINAGKLVMTSQPWTVMEGMTMTSRVTLWESAPGKQDFKMEFQQDGKWVDVGGGQLTKKK